MKVKREDSSTVNEIGRHSNIGASNVKIGNSTDISNYKVTKVPYLEGLFGAGPQVSDSWTKDMNDFIRPLYDEGMHFEDISKAIKEQFNIDKRPEAIRMHTRRTLGWRRQKRRQR